MILSQKRETRSDIFDELYLRNNVLQQALSRFLSSLVLFLHIYIYVCVCVFTCIYKFANDVFDDDGLSRRLAHLSS